MRTNRKRFGGIALLLMLALGLGAFVTSVIAGNSRAPKRMKFEKVSLVEKDVRKLIPVSADAQFLEEMIPDSISPLLASAETPKFTIDDLTGEYIHFFRTALQGDVDGGGKVTLTKSSTEPNVLNVTGFYNVTDPSLDFKLYFDPVEQTITLKTQTVLPKDDTYVGLDFAGSTDDVKPNRKASWVCKIDADGSFGFAGLWGLFVNGGLYVDQPLGVYQNIYFARPNARMKFNVPSGGNILAVDEPVFVWNYDDHDVMVENFFYNNGKPVKIKLNHDRTSTIRPQMAFVNNGRFSTGSGKVVGDKLESYSPTIVTPVATADNQISWTDWVLTLTQNEQMQFIGPITNTTLTLSNGKFNFPALGVSGFVGDGTEAAPYKISTVDDLKLLSYMVAEYFDDDATRAKAFTGKYFRLENDLDLTGINFIPIGNYSAAFDGVFDGNNHSISGLNLKRPGYNYVGLFGRAEENSIIRNLTVKEPEVVTDGIYVGGVVAYTDGSIENCHVVSPKILTTAYGMGGIASIAGSLKDCTVTKGQLLAQQGYVGGLVAQVVKGSITNCSVTETTIQAGGQNMTSPTPVGGIIGYLDEGTMSDSYFTGLIANGGVNYISLGGLAGMMKMSILERCFFAGHIATSGLNSYSHVGALVGQMNGKLTDSYSAGRVDAPQCEHAGGLTGYVIATETMPAVISNCYTSTSLNVRTFKYDMETEVRETLGTLASGANPTVNNIYYDSQITDFRSKKYSAGCSTLTNGELPEGFSSDVWVATAGQYPRLKKSADTEDAKFSATAYAFAENNTVSRVEKPVKINLLGETKAQFFIAPDKYSSEGHYGKITADNIIEAKGENGLDTLFFINGNRAFYHVMSFAPHAYEGKGTAEEPYLLKTKQDLINLSEATTSNGNKYSDTYFRIANDIDMEYDPNFLGISAIANANSFEGVIDGAGHTIHNLYLNGVVWTTRPEDSADGLGKGDTSKSKSTYGFIGRLGETGKLLNLNIAADADIQLWSTSGAFVGENNGLVENCRNYADIRAYFSWCAGIVADNNVKGVIRGCYNAGNIYGGNMMNGGINGQNRGVIEECMNVGNVYLDRVVSNISATSRYNGGGITGRCYGGIVKNVVNTGAISGNKSIGGIAGSINNSVASGAVSPNSVEGAVSYGPVYAEDLVKVGGIGGETGTTSTSCVGYYDRQIAPYAANGGSDLVGCVGMSTDELISGEVLKGLDPELWQFDKGMYPTLKRFADEPLAQAARRMIFNIPNKGVINELTEDVPLTQSEGVSFSLKQGTGFSIKDGKLMIPVKPKELVVDTLVMAYSNMTRPLVLKVYPVFPLEGEGTSESPYIIANAQDWNNLAGFITLKKETYEGKVFSITADIDFSSTPMVSMSTDKNFPFQGKLLGNKHTLKGIALDGGAVQYTGIFGYLGDKSEVKDLVYEGKISSTATYLGGLAGSLAGKLENVVNRATVSGTKADIGGIAAFVAATGEMIDCVNEGVVESTSTSSINYIGGLAAEVKSGALFIDCGNKGKVTAPKASYVAGLLASAEAVTMSGCYNDGEIVIGDPTSATTVAGLIATAKNSTKNTVYDITDCSNSANLTAKGDVAGLIAIAGNTTVGNVVMHISDCINTGNITSVGTTAAAGCTAGILGKYTPGLNIRNCVNKGAITSKGGKSTGGILGYKGANSTTVYPITVTNCHNYGEINAAGYHTSGIMGGEMAVCTIDGCSNLAPVSTTQYMAGGIASYILTKGAIIKNCFNMGDITVGQSQAGGILGTSTVDITITDCWNSGNIKSTNTAAGTATAASNNIGGIAGKGGGVISLCHNSGELTGLTQVGGIVGLPLNKITMINGCYNAGYVNAPEDACGPMVGTKVSTAWTEGTNKIENAYYASDRVKSTMEDTSIGVPFATLLVNAPEGWNSLDNYSLPVTDAHKNHDAAHLAAAQVVLADGDTFDKVTKAFHVGAHGNVKWTASGDIAFSGNDATLGKESGKMTLTATAGEYSKTAEITVYVASSVDDLAADKEILSTVYYTLDGKQVAEPVRGAGNVYIVNVVYVDGTHRTFKLTL